MYRHNRRLKYKSICQSTYNFCHRVEEYVVHNLIQNSWDFLGGPEVEILPSSMEDRVQYLTGEQGSHLPQGSWARSLQLGHDAAK